MAKKSEKSKANKEQLKFYEKALKEAEVRYESAKKIKGNPFTPKWKEAIVKYKDKIKTLKK